ELERLRPDPPLYPADPAARARALEIEEYFDEQVAPDLRRFFWAAYVGSTDLCARMATDGFGTATRVIWRLLFPVAWPFFRADMDMQGNELAVARDLVDKHCSRLEAEIGSSGYLAGDTFTIADLTAAAVMTAIIRPAGCPYPLPD